MAKRVRKLKDKVNKVSQCKLTVRHHFKVRQRLRAPFAAV